MYIANLETTTIKSRHKFILLAQVKWVSLEVEGWGKSK